MNINNMRINKENKIKAFVKRKGKKWMNIVIAILLLIVLIATGVMFYRAYADEKIEVIYIGCESKGEVVLNEYTEEIPKTINRGYDPLGFNLPFTTSKIDYIFTIKTESRVDLSAIEVEKKLDTVYVYMPEIFLTEGHLYNTEIVNNHESHIYPVSAEEEDDIREEAIKECESALKEGDYVIQGQETAETEIKAFIKKNKELKDLKVEFIWS